MKNLVIILVCVVVPFCCYSQNDYKQLEGIDTLRIIVEFLPSDFSNLGLSESLIRTDLELKLRLAKIPITYGLNSTHIYLQVSGHKLENPNIIASIYDITFRVKEEATLSRNKKFAFAEIWENGYIGISPNNELSTNVRNRIKDIMDMFLNDYLKANP
jgi:hypothetical protein